MPHVIKFDTVGDFENNTFADPRILMIITELRIWFCIACINHKRDDHPLLKLFIIINDKIKISLRFYTQPSGILEILCKNSVM